MPPAKKQGKEEMSSQNMYLFYIHIIFFSTAHPLNKLQPLYIQKYILFRSLNVELDCLNQYNFLCLVC